MFRLIIVILFSIVLTGCVNNYPHVKMIESGQQPTVAVYADVKDEIHFIFIGSTIFQNGYHKVGINDDLSKKIREHATIKLKQAGRVNVYDLTENDLAELKLIKPGPDALNSVEYEKDVGEWVKSKNIDFILVITEGQKPSPVYGRAGETIGIGMLDDTSYKTLLYTTLEGDLYAPSAEMNSRAISLTSALAVPTIEKNISQEELKAIKQKWAETAYDTLGPDEEAYFIEYEHIRYYAADYEKLDKQKISTITSRLDPVIKHNIEFLLDELLLTNQSEHESWYEFLPESTQPLF